MSLTCAECSGYAGLLPRLPSTIPPEQRLDAAQALVNAWMEGQFDRWIARKVYANRTLRRLCRRWWFRSIPSQEPYS
jgi:hypothetical protein